MSLNRAHPQMELADSEFHETAGEKIALTFNPANAESCLPAPATVQEIAELGKTAKHCRTFRCRIAKSSSSCADDRDQLSESGARLARQRSQLEERYVVLSAHIDHIGIGERLMGTHLQRRHG